MRTPASSVRSITLALSVLVPSLALLWFLAVPGTLTPASYSFFAALLTALAVVGIITYGNAQATSSMAQVIYEADTAPVPATADVRRVATQARPQA
jgi:hypothetical protein